MLQHHGRVLGWSAGGAAVLTAVAIFTVDGPVAVTAAGLSADTRRLIQAAVHLVEVAFAFGWSPYLYGVLVIAAGLVCAAWRAPRVGRLLLFVGLTHVTARFAADILKAPFSRLRPYEALAGGAWHDVWFASAGNAFPSGHAVHFWSLFFPLLVVLPRGAVAWAILPIAVSMARIAANDHYVGDVLASMAIAAAVCWVYDVALLRGNRVVRHHRQPAATS